MKQNPLDAPIRSLPHEFGPRACPNCLKTVTPDPTYHLARGAADTLNPVPLRGWFALACNYCGAVIFVRRPHPWPSGGS